MLHDLDRDAFHGFIDESLDSLQGIEADFIALEQDPANPDLINRIFRPVHSLKGNSGFFGLSNINKFAHRLENLLDSCRKGEIMISRPIIDVLLEGVEFLQGMLARAQADPADSTLQDADREFLSRVEAIRPSQVVGTVQSVLAFEALLQEYLNLGQELRDSSLIASLLDQIEKANGELASLIAVEKNRGPACCYRSDCRYLLGERDYSADLAALDRVAQFLAEGKPTDRESLAAFTAAFSRVEAALAPGSTDALAGALDELAGMQNFLDDPLMASSAEYRDSCRRLIDTLIGAFEARPVSGGGSRLGEILVEQQLASEEQIAAALAKQKKIGELLVEDGVLQPEEMEKAIGLQQKRMLDTHLGQGTAAVDHSKTIRIDQARIDQFADAVGELYISLDSLGYLRKEFEANLDDFGLVAKFASTLHVLDEHLEELHLGIMNIRRVPVKTLFQRFPKVIRQLAASLGKDVLLVTRGEETVIDKDILEKIENPLVHILRNSLDHGLETPALRKDAGKAAQGILSITCTVDENNVYLGIEDDGAGIDPQKMRAVALKKGFMAEAELAGLSDAELINLIFKPGFSTAEKVSDVSGRGVGMDVVMSGLKECNGTITMSSVVGKGTTVAIVIPLTKTLVTKEAMLVQAGGKTYAIPTAEISTAIEAARIIPLLDGDNCIAYDGTFVRLVDLDACFYPQEREAKTSPDAHQVVVVSKEHGIGLLVDAVLAHQKVVAKEFGGYERLREVGGVAGYTIMGDGEIGLIADLKQIAARG